MSRRHAHADERGAVAILTGLLVVVLCLISAFCIDFGMAYNSKRQLQTGADAGATAAAAVYANAANPGACTQAFLDAHEAAALAAARDYRDRNRPSANDKAFSVACVDGTIEVTYEVSGSTDTFFGKLAGVNSITTDRKAVAVTEVATSAGSGLRPLAICSADLPTGTLTSSIVRLDGPGGGTRAPTQCPDAGRAGNWWSIDCPENGSNGNLADDILNGCDDFVSIVPGQPPVGDPFLSSYLTVYCGISRNEYCLSSNPGNLRGQVPAAFQSLVDSGKTVLLPVFCGGPHCTPAALTVAGGNNVIYPVHKMIGVQICGYHLGGSDNNNISGSGDCTAANNPQGYDPDDGNNQDNYLLVAVKEIQVSGSTRPSGCRLGDACDTWMRQVRLVE